MDVRLENLSDIQLMLSVKEGNRKAFQILFQRHAGNVKRFARRFVGDPSIAEEMVQEIFFKIYRSADAYNPHGKFTGYLYRVATNHCLNEIRRAVYHQRFDSIEQSHENCFDHPIDPTDLNEPGPEARLSGYQLAIKMESYLKELPCNQRKALLLNRLEDRTYQEIATTLAVSVGAVKSLLHRARTNLKNKIEVFNETINQEVNPIPTSP
mgnify:CR=1 FL=1